MHFKNEMAPQSHPYLRFVGPIRGLSDADRRLLLERLPDDQSELSGRVRDLLAEVRTAGDRALKEMALRFDKVELQSIEVPKRDWTEALDRLSPSLRKAMERAARNIATAHRAFLPKSVEVETEPGVLVGRRPDPLSRVGVYAPGGKAAYPSSVLMGAVPAKVAGVSEVVVCSPPGPDGRPTEVVLAAAALAGVDRVFALGGAGAIAAMTFGTSTVPRVERIVGPGNAYVAEAKRQVSGMVGIDSPAGPSEILILADAQADPAVLVREMLAQAEHDPLAAVALVCLDPGVAKRSLEILESEVPKARRRDTIEQSLKALGAVLTAENLDEGIAFAEAFAAEHLMLALKDGPAVLPRMRCAGTIFTSENASVAFGDYLTGSNHVLPTMGLARAYSGLSVQDFIRWTSYQHVSREAAARMAEDVGVFADSEGLFAHAAAARAWEKA